MKEKFIKIIVTLILFSNLLIANYNVTVTSDDGYRTALMGKGSEINHYISNKIKQAKKGDTIRLNYYLLTYFDSNGSKYRDTRYFYNAIKSALQEGARIEIITEGKNTLKSEICLRLGDSEKKKGISENTYRSSMLFLYGSESLNDVNCSSKTVSFDNIQPLNGILSEDTRHNNSLKVYIVDHAGDSNYSRAIDHRKVVLLDINGTRDIIISTANIYGFGEIQWQAAIDLDGNHYDSQWRWWNDVLDTDRCFAKGNRNCRIGNGGYELNDEGGISSYVIDHVTSDNEDSTNVMVDWMKDMKPSEGCELKVVMGHFSSRAVLDEMGKIALDCNVTLIYGKEYLKANPDTPEKHVNNFQDDDDKTPFRVIKQSNGSTKVHAKMILWNGNWLANGHRYYSWVGSLNATTKALNHNDETMVRVVGETIHNAYSEYFDWIIDTDNDGKIDAIDLDDDGDGYSDNIEISENTNPLDETSKPLDTDGDFEPDSIDLDDDGDKISDEDEKIYGLDPLIADANMDNDGDGISNIYEIDTDTDPTNRHDPNPHYLKNDFNGDGYVDLVIGEPNATVGNVQEAGEIFISYGSSEGIGDSNISTINQETGNVPGNAEVGDHFGAVLSTGNYNGDGFADIAIGIPDEDIGNIEDAGYVTILYGSSDGISTDNYDSFYQSTLTPNYEFGKKLISVKYDNNESEELIVFFDNINRSNIFVFPEE